MSIQICTRSPTAYCGGTDGSLGVATAAELGGFTFVSTAGLNVHLA